MGGLSSSTRLVPPSLANVKSLHTFTEYPLCSLPQITEAYQYYRQSNEYQHHIPTLALAGFEEIFGQLFPDPAQHFYALQQSSSASVGYVVILDVFYILILFCDASNEEKLQFLCLMNHDLDLNNLRIDALQLMLFRLLHAMTLVFKAPPQNPHNSTATTAMLLPTRDDVYQFLDASIKQFQDRNRVANQNNPYYQLAQNNATNDPTRPFSFHDFWQWCQDVNQISIYLDAIESICSIIIASVDRSHKGRQYMILRNSFFNFSLKNTSQSTASFIDPSTSNNGGSNHLQSTLQNVMHLIQEQESLDLTQYALHHRHPLWKYSLQELVNEHWFEDMHTQTTLETKVFTSLEHMILSHRHVMPIFVPQGFNPLQPVVQNLIPGMPATGGHRFSAALTPSNNRGSIATSAMGTPTSARGSTFGTKPFAEPFSPAATPGSLHSRSSLAKGTPSQSTASLTSNNSDAQQQQQQPMQHPVHRMELLSVIDQATVLSWVVMCMPATVLDAYKQQEEEQEEVVRSKRASFDMSTTAKKRSTALVLASLRASNPLETNKEDDDEEEEEDEEEDEENNKDGEEEDKEGDEHEHDDGEDQANDEDSDVVANVLPSMIRFKQRHKNVNQFRNQWQTVGHTVAHSPLLSIFQTDSYTHLRKRYDITSPYHHVHYVHQPVYNVIALIAGGYRYVPIGANNRAPGAAVASSPNKLLHILEPYEVAAFLFQHFDEFFNQYHHQLSSQHHRGHGLNEDDSSGQPTPAAAATHEPFRYATQPPSPEKAPPSSNTTAPQFMNKTIYQSGFMRKPCCIPAKHNVGTALFLLLQSKLDAALIVNENNKVCSVLSVHIMQKLWWHWKKQHLPMNTMTVHDLKHDYHQEAYHYLYGSAKNESYLANQPQHKHKYGNVPAADLYNYSLFSALMNPMAHGDVVGLEYQDFDDFVNAPMPQADGLLSMKLLHSRAHHLNQPSMTSVTTMSTDDDASSLATDSKMNQSTVTDATRQSALPGGRGPGLTARPPPVAGNLAGRLGFRNIRTMPGGRGGGGVIGGIHLNQTLKDKQREESKAKAYKSRRMEQWFFNHKVITPNDSIRTALYVMSQSKLSCVYVVSTTGEPIGVVTLQDICKYLVQSEARSKSIHSDIQARDNNKMVRIISKAQNPAEMK